MAEMNDQQDQAPREAAPEERRPERGERERSPRGGRGERGARPPRGDRDDRGERGGRRPRRFQCGKLCVYTVEQANYVDFKDVERLRAYLADNGKILPRRISGTCAMHQRKLQTAIKRARQIALIPYVTD